MLAQGAAKKANQPALKALFSLSVNTAAAWKSLYLNDNNSVNVNALRKREEDQPRSPKRRWSDIEELAPWDANKAEGDGALSSQASKRAAQDHRACQTSTLHVTTIKDNLQVLMKHVPSFCYSQSQLSPTLLIRLSEDMHAVFDRLAALRALLPRNDISSMIGLRPDLLLREVFEGVVPALRELAETFPGADIPRVVERQPYLLIPDCQVLLSEMMRERTLPLSMSGYVGDADAANQVERILMHVQSSAIQGTQTFQQDRKRVLESCSRPKGMPTWEDLS